MVALIASLCVCLSFIHVSPVIANRVLELNDKFVEIYAKERHAFIIKFYAPWCHHCHALEPVWAQVAQQLHNREERVIVARLDCTKYTTTATHFAIKGFPTIMFVSADKRVEFRGDRNKEDIIDFALRVNGPPVRPLSHCNDIDSLRKTHSVFFTQFGDTVNENFSQIAANNQCFDWYYHLRSNCSSFSNGIYVIKSPNFQQKYDDHNLELNDWIKSQRFSQFVKITTGNLHLILQTQKYLVIALLEEYKQIGKLANSKNEQFYELMEAIANTYPTENRIIIGWTSELSTINSIAIKTITPLPNFIVINATTLQYYLTDEQLLPQNIINILDQIKSNPEKIMFAGGDTFYYRLLRVIYDTITSLVSMFHGNPVLTLLLFGLPLSFLSIIIYTTCFSDILDAKEEEDEDEDNQEKHEKRD